MNASVPTHSPAPWRAKHKGLGNYLIVDASGDYVATTHTDTPAGNGPILAAGPEMLAALKHLLKVPELKTALACATDRRTGDSEVESFHQPSETELAVEEAVQAIAKADVKVSAS